MSEKVGVKETTEAIKATFATVRKIWEIKKEGVAGLPKLVTLYGELEAGIRGGDKIPAECKDLDQEEIKQIITLATTEMGETLETVGVKGISPYLKLTAKAVEAAEGTYSTWKPIVDEINALRTAPKEYWGRNPACMSTSARGWRLWPPPHIATHAFGRETKCHHQQAIF